MIENLYQLSLRNIPLLLIIPPEKFVSFISEKARNTLYESLCTFTLLNSFEDYFCLKHPTKVLIFAIIFLRSTESGNLVSTVFWCLFLAQFLLN